MFPDLVSWFVFRKDLGIASHETRTVNHTKTGKAPDTARAWRRSGVTTTVVNINSKFWWSNQIMNWDYHQHSPPDKSPGIKYNPTSRSVQRCDHGDRWYPRNGSSCWYMCMRAPRLVPHLDQVWQLAVWQDTGDSGGEFNCVALTCRWRRHFHYRWFQGVEWHIFIHVDVCSWYTRGRGRGHECLGAWYCFSVT